MSVVFRGELVCIDKTECEVSSGGCVRRTGATKLDSSSEVRVQNFKSFLRVAHVDHAETCRGAEPIPVCGCCNPLQIIVDERVICGVCVHHCVHPNSGRMKHRVLLRNRILGLANKDHVSVVVFLKELEDKTLFDLTS